MIHRDSQYAVATNLLRPVWLYRLELDCRFLRRSFQEIGVELAIQQVCRQGIINSLGSIDFYSSFVE